MIRVLIVEDSPVQRQFLQFVLEESGEFEVVGTAGNGAEALRQTEALRPDIILMDCYMPGIGGLEATKMIMEQCPTPIVVASASLAFDEAQITFEAMSYGALAVVEKPASFATPGHEKMAEALLRTLRLMSEVKVVGRRARPLAAQADAKLAVAGPGPVDVIAMCGSTGAPGVMADILGALDSVRLAPILIVQHLTEGFVGRFARWLDGKTALTVRLASEGVAAKRGHVYVAPDGLQAGISALGRIELTENPPEDGFRPSATHLFRSVATVYGPRGMGILLTGMGCDGAAGLLAIRRAGGRTAVQDPESCVVNGMPGTAVRLGAAMDVLPPRSIAKLIQSSQPEKAEKFDHAQAGQTHVA